MIVNHINNKGMFSDGQFDGSSSIKIDNLSNNNKSMLAVSTDGVVQNVSIAEKQDTSIANIHPQRKHLIRQDPNF